MNLQNLLLTLLSKKNVVLIFSLLFFYPSSLFSQQIYNSKEWKILFHVDENGKSEIDDPNYFLAEGEFSLEKEYYAALNNITCENICRFPARYKFLSDNLGLKIDFSHCQDFQNFLSKSIGDSVSIVFATSYLGAPMSYFGHTFLKINKPNNKFFSQTISYAAIVPEGTDILELIYKGISGGFKGIYLVAPYYKLLNKYNDIEQRSVIEYKLNLNQYEVERLLYHAYELLSVNKSYKYFKENCAYELLWLIEYARPDLELKAQLNVYVIPYEIVDLMFKNGLVSEVNETDALIEELYLVYNSLNTNEKKFFTKWRNIKNKVIELEQSNFSNETKNKLSYLINGYYDFLFKRKHVVLQDYEEIRQLKYKPFPIDHSKIKYAPKKSHKIYFGVIKEKDGMGVESIFTPVLYNRYEERDNNISINTLEFMSLHLKYINSVLKLESFDVAKIESYKRMFDFFKPLSWRFYIGANRSIDPEKIEPLGELGVGVTKGTDNLIFYFLLQEALYPIDLSLDTQIVAGINMWINKTHLGLDVKKSIFHINNRARQELDAFIFYPLNKSFAIENHYNITQKAFSFRIVYRF